MELVIASGNRGKIAEIQEFLATEPFALRNLADFSQIIEVAETGDTFAENAILKAEGYARQTCTLTLADDSGLEIDALGGAPGVLSARYGGEKTGYDEKMKLVLGELAGSGEKERRARFVCVMALADKSGKILGTAKGICEGNIAFEPRGTGGFGYDPIFIPTGFSETFGELGNPVKQQISHRKRAFLQIMPFLLDFMRV